MRESHAPEPPTHASSLLLSYLPGRGHHTLIVIIPDLPAAAGAGPFPGQSSLTHPNSRWLFGDPALSEFHHPDPLVFPPPCVPLGCGSNSTARGVCGGHLLPHTIRRPGGWSRDPTPSALCKKQDSLPLVGPAGVGTQGSTYIPPMDRAVSTPLQRARQDPL